MKNEKWEFFLVRQSTSITNCVHPSVSWWLVGWWSVGDAFVRRFIRRTLLAYLALFRPSPPPHTQRIKKHPEVNGEKVKELREV